MLGAMLMLIRETLLLTVRNEFMAAPEETGAGRFADIACRMYLSFVGSTED